MTYHQQLQQHKYVYKKNYYKLSNKQWCSLGLDTSARKLCSENERKLCSENRKRDLEQNFDLSVIKLDSDAAPFCILNILNVKKSVSTNVLFRKSFTNRDTKTWCYSICQLDCLNKLIHIIHDDVSIFYNFMSKPVCPSTIHDFQTLYLEFATLIHLSSCLLPYCSLTITKRLQPSVKLKH